MAAIKKYNGSTWETTTARKYETATETIQSGDTIYADGTAATVSLKGNTVQNGTPSPSSPVDVVGVGELETTGEHSGEYKIPISNGQQTTNIYLGSTQTVRQVKKLVLDGTEDWRTSSTYPGGFFCNNLLQPCASMEAICSYFENTTSAGDYSAGQFLLGGTNNVNVNMRQSNTSWTTSNFKTWLAQEYANGTPVTIWYVLVTPETAIVNEPLMKIGDYADTLSNATAIPTTEGANSITVDTTVQPSEFTATWTGWHNASVKEWDGSQWQ